MFLEELFDFSCVYRFFAWTVPSSCTELLLLHPDDDLVSISIDFVSCKSSAGKKIAERVRGGGNVSEELGGNGCTCWVVLERGLGGRITALLDLLSLAVGWQKFALRIVLGGIRDGFNMSAVMGVGCEIERGFVTLT